MRKTSTTALRKYARALKNVQQCEINYNEEKQKMRAVLRIENQLCCDKDNLKEFSKKASYGNLRSFHQKLCKRAKYALRKAHQEFSRRYNVLCRNFIK